MLQREDKLGGQARFNFKGLFEVCREGMFDRVCAWTYGTNNLIIIIMRLEYMGVKANATRTWHVCPSLGENEPFVGVRCSI